MDQRCDERNDSRSGPLQNLRVLDVSTILAGPLCCRILGDFGADVIKVEHPRAGDGMRGHGLAKDGVSIWWKEISRNKRGLTLDLSAPAGARVLRRLAMVADVLVENFRPGTLERWGLAPDELLALNPRLIVLRVTGWGQSGPYSRRAGFGTLAEAMSGFAHLTGEAGGPPTLPAFGLADSVAGITGACAVLTALHHRDTEGTGQVIDVNLLQPMMNVVGPSPSYYDQLGHIEQRHGNRSTNNAPRNTYRTADGQWVAVSSSAQRVAERVMVLVGGKTLTKVPWFSSGRGRAEHAEEIDQKVADWVGRRRREEVLAEFDAAGAAVAPVYTAEDLCNDPHVSETQMLVRVPDAELGSVRMHNVMWGMSQTPGTIRFTGRGLGADTDAILSECGLTKQEISELRSEGII